jgi:hypothetical protein
MDITCSHLVEVNEEERTLTIYRVIGSERQLYTSVKLPEKTWAENADAIRDFCRTLGENILIDSPQARKLLKM